MTLSRPRRAESQTNGPETTESTALLGTHASTNVRYNGTENKSIPPTSPPTTPGAASRVAVPSLSEDPGILSPTESASFSDWKRRWAGRIRSKKMTRSTALAESHGFRDGYFMYLSYYVPILIWIRKYRWSHFKGDLVAALTVAGIYIPVALSLADQLAHVPPINGLYSYVFNPLIYAFLGSCPEMVLGPEAAGSLLVGTVVKSSIDRGRGGDDDGMINAKICGVVTGMAGAFVLMAGLARLGFVDGVLSRPFLRGFISAIGFVIAVDQLIPELGLSNLEKRVLGPGHPSSVDKLAFLFSHLDHVHRLTFTIAGVSFLITMVCRELKKRLQPRYPNIAYVPDRLTIVALSAVLAWYCDWEKQGVAVLGAVEAPSGNFFAFRWPFQPSHTTHIREAMGTSFLIGLLGFFESSVAAKSLDDSERFGIQLSSNRELVALGMANFVGACFMSLPAFGGYGRSKVSKSTGAKSPMSSILLSVITTMCILFFLPYLYYLPKPVLSSMISVVAWSLLEECPQDVAFFISIRAWSELGLMLVIILATIFYSLSLGIAIGVGLSLLLVVRHSSRPRIQILGRIPGTQRYVNPETNPERLEFVDGCLIIKIPEPMTFVNTSQLKTRLRRLERYGTNQAHPALPRLRRENLDRNVIFDMDGVAWIDGSGSQVLDEIVRRYRERGIQVFFCRVPLRGSVRELIKRSGILALMGGESHLVADVEAALRMAEAAHNEASDSSAV